MHFGAAVDGTAGGNDGVDGKVVVAPVPFLAAVFVGAIVAGIVVGVGVIGIGDAIAVAGVVVAVGIGVTIDRPVLLWVFA